MQSDPPISAPPSKPPSKVHRFTILSQLSKSYCFVFIVVSWVYFLDVRKAYLQDFQQTRDSFMIAPGIEEVLQVRKPKLADGCYHVYLDVGSNIGIHNRFLFEPEKYPDAKVSRGIFDKHFGANRSNKNLCAFGFEPNPTHKARHEALRESYHRMGWRYHFINAGVGDHNGNMTFFHNRDVGSEEWGFSSTPRKKRSTPEVVPIVRLAEWIENQVKGRLIPNTQEGNRSLAPTVVMKMDIEGMEYVVLPDLFFSGVACTSIDYIFGEFHSFHTETSHARGSLSLNPSSNEQGIFKKQLLKAFHSVRHCKTTRFDLIDDESYLHDGIPFPE